MPYRWTVLTGTFTIAATLLLVSNLPSSAADEVGAVINAPAYTREGRIEMIAVQFDRSIHGPAVLEVFTFHYPMYPDLAIEEDTWIHQRQMHRMAEVLAGRQEPYAPDPDDSSLRAILEASTVETLALTSAGDNRTFSTTWKANHGRIFFRIRLNDVPIRAVASTRAHCVHINMKSVEQLKQSVSMLETPLTHEHGEMADLLYQRVASTYRSGHGFQHMLVHHELGADRLDALLGGLGAEIAARSWPEARQSVQSLKTEIAVREQEFFEVEIEERSGRIRLTFRDLIKGYSFSDASDTAVFLKQGPLIAPAELHARLRDLNAQSKAAGPDHTGHGSQTPDSVHAGHDPAMHQAMAAFDRDEVTRDAIELSRADGGFEVARDLLGDSQGPFTVIALYGDGQAFYLTREVEL